MTLLVCPLSRVMDLVAERTPSRVIDVVECIPFELATTEEAPSA